MNSEEYYYSESDFNFTTYDINEYIESFVTENTKNDASRVFLVRKITLRKLKFGFLVTA